MCVNASVSTNNDIIQHLKNYFFIFTSVFSLSSILGPLRMFSYGGTGYSWVNTVQAHRCPFSTLPNSPRCSPGQVHFFHATYTCMILLSVYYDITYSSRNTNEGKHAVLSPGDWLNLSNMIVSCCIHVPENKVTLFFLFQWPFYVTGDPSTYYFLSIYAIVWILQGLELHWKHKHIGMEKAFTCRVEAELISNSLSHMSQIKHDLLPKFPGPPSVIS